MLLDVSWTPRMPAAPPLVAAGLLIHGDRARRMAQQLLGLRLPQVEAVFGADALVLLGVPELLPWINGVVYLGRDPAEPRLYMPNTLAPSVPPEWLASALARQYSLRPPFAVTEQMMVIPLAGARMLDEASLTRWLEA